MLDIAVYENRLIAVGERGHVLVSDDAGDHWQQVVTPVQTTLTGIFMLDRNRAWVTGHDATILRTNDGGNSWQQVHHQPELESPLLDIWFADELNGIAIGAYGLYLQTQDGGQSWQQRTIADEDFHLNSLAASSRQQLLIAAEAGHLYRSDNLGRDWSKLKSPYHGSFFSAGFLDEKTIVVAGLRGHLYRSDDGGDTFEAIPTDSDGLLSDVKPITGSGYIVVGHGGTVLLSDATGTLTNATQAERFALNAVVQTGEGKFIAVTDKGIQVLTIGTEENR